MKPYEQETLLNFTHSKAFEPFKDRVKFGSTTAETSLEIHNTIKKIRPSLRFYEDGSSEYCDCNVHERKLLGEINTAWENYAKSFRGRMLKAMFKFMPY